MMTVFCRAHYSRVSCGAEKPGSISSTVPFMCCLPALIVEVEGSGSSKIFLELLPPVQ